jgi:fusion and transport protein UGO1
VDISLLLRSLLATAFLQYTSTAIAMPWEVGKLLLQVQWVPRDASGIPEPPATTVPLDEDEDGLSDSSTDNDSYFTDPNNGEPIPVPRLSNDQGYVVRRSVLEEGTRPEYIIPVGSANGVWGMIKRIGRFRGEGWLALWKGLLTFCINDALFAAIQPLIDNPLKSLFFSPATPFQQPPLFIPIASHLFTGLILSPLDLIRTRLIIQSSIPRYRTYTGPIDAISQILHHEGGLKGIYLHPHLLIPTIIDHTLRPLVAIAVPTLLAAYVGTPITAASHPIVWGVAEFMGNCAGLLITLPFETVRRRLQAQVRGSARPVKACVEMRPAPYNGVVDTLWHILTEERSDLPLKVKRARRGSRASKGKQSEQQLEREEEESWFRNTGLGQLYRGLGMRLGASAIVFVLALVSGGEEGDSGWAEL